MRTLFTALALLALSAGTTPAAAEDTLTGEQLKKEIPGSAVTYQSDSGFPFRMDFKAGGGLAGRCGPRSDRGKWWVDNDKLCRQWNKWGRNSIWCFKVAKAPGEYRWIKDNGGVEVRKRAN